MEYYSPTELTEAYKLLSQYGDDAIPIAGNTFFMGHREELFDEVEVVVNIKKLGLSYIKEEEGKLKIGATTTLNELFYNPITNSGEYKIFAETVNELNITEVRNMATIGGEVCIAGEVDMPTTLLALDVDIVIGSEKGVRSVSMADFHIGYLNNDLNTGEMVIEVQVPKPAVNTSFGFSKFERTAADLPIVNVCVRVTLDKSGICSDARVSVGAATLAGVPKRSEAAENVLNGNKIDEGLIEKAAEASADIECINDFRTPADVRSLWIKCGVEDALKKALDSK
jgi:aerobic carbon-monoxide dehydrogenase medium subunit